MSKALNGIQEYVGQFPEHDQCDIRVWAAAEALAQAETKLEAMERAIEVAGREIGSIRCPEDERYARNALIVLAAAAQQEKEDE